MLCEWLIYLICVNGKRRIDLVIDAFMFFNELEILEIRLRELYDVVDRFVILESNYSHMLKPKSLLFGTASVSFSPWIDKIEYVIVPDEIMTADKRPHKVEQANRDYIAKYLNGKIKDDDVLIMSDIDEIPSAGFIKYWLDNNNGKNRFSTSMYRYYLNLYFQQWHISHIGKWKYYKPYANNLSSLRRHKIKDWHLMNSRGWHFSSVGTMEQIWNKVNNFYHAKEHAHFKKLDKDRISQRIKDRLHPFKDGAHRGEIVGLDNMPYCVRTNIDKFGHLLLEEDACEQVKD